MMWCRRNKNALQNCAIPNGSPLGCDGGKQEFLRRHRQCLLRRRGAKAKMSAMFHGDDDVAKSRQLPLLQIVSSLQGEKERRTPRNLRARPRI
jgi:hypothetical protein